MTAMSAAAPLLTIRGLEKSYVADKPVLKGIDLDVHPGEFVVVIGPSGAGKSTFIRCLNRMIDPTAGSIVVDGVETTVLKGKALRELRSSIGMIFQHYNLIARRNVLTNVLHGRLGQMPFIKSALGLYSGADRTRAVELLDTVGMSDHIYAKAGSLSGGQMQRVGICRAMMQSPKLLLADEPIASLDPKSARTVMDEIAMVTMKYGVTCIMNLHQVDVARKYATRIIGIKGGVVVFDGAPADLSEEMVADIYGDKLAQSVLKADTPELELAA
jgi:phosphonate transport system ATP-binding protein